MYIFCHCSMFDSFVAIATAHLCDAVTPIPIVLATPTGGNEQIIQSLRYIL